MDFNFPRKCTYCKSQFRVNNCLLPFNLTEESIKCTNEMEYVQQVIHLHQIYGEDELTILFHKTNYVSEKYKEELVQTKSRERSQTGSPISQPPSISSRTWSDRIGDKESTNDEQEELEPIDDLRRDFPPLPLIKGKKKDQNPITRPKEEKEDKAVPLTKEQTLATINEIESMPVSKEKEETVNIETLPEIEDHFIEHIVYDITLVLQYVSKMRTPGIGHNITIENCLTTLEQEFKYLQQHGDKYERKQDAQLNSVIGFTKRVYSIHSTKQLTDWWSNEKHTHQRGCLLLFQKLSRTNSASMSHGLQDSLLEYIQLVLGEKTFSPQSRIKVKDTLLNYLEFQKLTSLWTWYKGETLSLRRRQQAKLLESLKPESSNKGKIALTTKQTGRNTRHICPGLTNELEEYANNKLPSVIQRVLQANPTQEIKYPEKMDSTTYFLKLVKEFQSHNKGWMNTNSMTTEKHFRDVENNCEFKTEFQYVFICFKLLQKILEIVRKETKPTTE